MCKTPLLLAQVLHTQMHTCRLAPAHQRVMARQNVIWRDAWHCQVSAACAHSQPEVMELLTNSTAKLPAPVTLL
jgi:hypothetical protein